MTGGCSNIFPLTHGCSREKEMMMMELRKWKRPLMAKKTPMIKPFIDCMCTIIMHAHISDRCYNKQICDTYTLLLWLDLQGWTLEITTCTLVWHRLCQWLDGDKYMAGLSRRFIFTLHAGYNIMLHKFVGLVNECVVITGPKMIFPTYSASKHDIASYFVHVSNL